MDTPVKELPLGGIKVLEFGHAEVQCFCVLTGYNNIGVNVIPVYMGLSF